MSALYWEDHDCTEESRTIVHELTKHEHYQKERDACLAFLGYRQTCQQKLDTIGETDPAMKYRCIRGPRGLLRGVVL